MPIFRMPVVLHANSPHANSPATVSLNMNANETFFTEIQNFIFSKKNSCFIKFSVYNIWKSIVL